MPQEHRRGGQLDLLDADAPSPKTEPPSVAIEFDADERQAIYGEVVKAIQGSFAVSSSHKLTAAEMLTRVDTFLDHLRDVAAHLEIDLDQEDYEDAIRVYMSRVVATSLDEALLRHLSTPLQPLRGGAVVASHRRVE